MACFRVQITCERTITFYVDAEDKTAVEGFLDSHPEWAPGDVDGLIEVVGDELEVDYSVKPEERITANFEITEDLELREKDG